MAYALWDRVFKFNPRDPLWPDRDRFVHSAGHGSALLYALLHVTGFDLPLEELTKFRQWGSRTPGHPEYGKIPGVEATTGPLGQGLANAAVLADFPPGAVHDIILIAIGSEIHLAVEAREQLATEGIYSRVVSLPSTNVVSMQSDKYRDKILPPGIPLLAIEAGASLGWKSYVDPQITVIGVDTFGASAPGTFVMQH